MPLRHPLLALALPASRKAGTCWLSPPACCDAARWRLPSPSSPPLSDVGHSLLGQQTLCACMWVSFRPGFLRPRGCRTAAPRRPASPPQPAAWSSAHLVLTGRRRTPVSQGGGGGSGETHGYQPPALPAGALPGAVCCRGPPLRGRSWVPRRQKAQGLRGEQAGAAGLWSGLCPP